MQCYIPGLYLSIFACECGLKRKSKQCYETDRFLLVLMISCWIYYLVVEELRFMTFQRWGLTLFMDHFLIAPNPFFLSKSNPDSEIAKKSPALLYSFKVYRSRTFSCATNMDSIQKLGHNYKKTHSSTKCTTWVGKSEVEITTFDLRKMRRKSDQYACDSNHFCVVKELRFRAFDRR